MVTTFLLATIGQTLAGVLMFLISLFLILLVLVQRGRGGGLAGAFGGMGGQSAFGAKAGDTFTRITIVAASVWIAVCMFSVMMFGNASEKAAATILDTEIPSATSNLEQDLSLDGGLETLLEGAGDGVDATSTESSASSDESGAAETGDAAAEEASSSPPATATSTEAAPAADAKDKKE